MADVVVLVPYRSDGGRRDELWEFTLGWLMKHHDSWAVITGDSPEGAFNRGAAINDAARRAGDWDVAIVHDADNIADPAMLKLAVERAREGEKGCVFPFSTYLYLDEFSTNRLMAENNWFVCPERRQNRSQDWPVIGKHHSGVQVLSREAYEQVGGFVELTGWGFEDSIMSVLLQTFTPGIEHLEGSALHLYHGNNSDPERKTYGTVNQRVLGDVMALSVVPEQLRAYLKSGGHPIL